MSKKKTGDSLEYVATRTFTSTSIPGYEGQLQDFNRGLTRVDGDHPAVLAHPDSFAKLTSPAGAAAQRSTGRSAPRPHSVTRPSASARRSRETKRPTSSRSKPPWSDSDGNAHLQVARPGAVRDDGIWDLSTVRYSVDEEATAGLQFRDRALRGIERFRFPHSHADATQIRHHLASLIEAEEDHFAQGSIVRHILLTGSPRYREIFAKASKCGSSRLSAEERAALGVTNNGGAFLLPITLDPTIIPTSNGVLNPLRAISRVETTTTNVWKGVSSSGISAQYTEAGEEAADDTPSLARVEVECERADAWVPEAYEIAQDFGQIEPQIAALVQREKDTLEATKMLTGTGEKEPLGLLTGLTEAVETAASGTLAAGDIEAVEAALPAGFLDEATWLGHREIYKKARRFDSAGGSKMWQKLPGGKPELLDIPAEYLSTLPSAVAGGNKVLVLGDFEYFLIADRIGMSVKFLEVPGAHGFPTGQMGVFLMWRNGSTVLSKNAFRVLKVKP